MLARRDYSRAELAARLAPHAGEGDELAALLDALEASGLLSDPRFAAERARVRGAALGNQRLAQELRQRGLDPALIDETLATIPDEYTRARAVWEKKFARPPADRNEWVKQARFLQARGFAAGTIRRVLDSPDDESS